MSGLPANAETKRFIIAMCQRLFALPVLLFSLQAAASEPVNVRVVGVHDGDTITCLTANKEQMKVRLDAIDAPELKQPFGQRSKETLSGL